VAGAQGHRIVTTDQALHDTLLAARPVIAATFHDPWWIIGSAAMALSGVPGVAPDDVDVLCSQRDADALRVAWRAHVDDGHVPQDGARFRSRFARFTQLHMPLEVMGGLEVMSAEGWQPVRVAATACACIGGIEVPVPSLAEQVRILRLFGRGKDLARVAVLTGLNQESHHVA
jgi:hypothetical protein